MSLNTDFFQEHQKPSGITTSPSLVVIKHCFFCLEMTKNWFDSLVGVTQRGEVRRHHRHQGDEEENLQN